MPESEYRRKCVENPSSRKRQLDSPGDDEDRKRSRPDPITRKRSRSPLDNDEPNKRFKPNEPEAERFKRPLSPGDEQAGPSKRIRSNDIERPKRPRSPDTEPKAVLKKHRPAFQSGRKRVLEGVPLPSSKKKRLRGKSIECSPEPQEGGWLSYN
jgi:hypothetical protein